MKSSKELHIGLNVMKMIKGSQVPLTTTILADKSGTTSAFLSQIMKKLRKSELVNSQRGPGGGYVLNSSRAEISAFDVAVALDYEFISAANALHKEASAAVGLEVAIMNAFIGFKL